VLHQPQRPADDRVGVRPVRRRRGGVRLGEPGPQHGDQQQVEQPVQDGFLARLVPADLGAEQRQQPAGG
jgi:hypothetical protein